MSARGYHRGHEMVFDEAAQLWCYVDTGQPVPLIPDRPCGYRGPGNTPKGHDGCLGTLPGVMNACCGHGRTPEAYIQFWGGRRRVSGEEARAMQEALKNEPCIGGNPGCPCQDGFLCHYKGENPWPIP